MEKVKGAYTNGEMTDIGEFIASSTQALDSIAGKRTVGDFKTAEEVAKTVARQIDLEKNRANKRLTGVDTGYTTLNKYTHGWQKGDLIILAARPSVGKTAFAINLAYNAAVHENKTVAFFSCEMSSDQIMKRLCSSVALVNSEAVQTGDLYGNDVIKVNNALEQIQHTKLFFDDTSNPILGDLLAKARKLQAAHPDLCLIMIDYLNLIGTGTHLESRSQEVSVITRSLKELARSLKVPVIALAQLNRDVEKSDNKIPMLSNLKESGSIEQDADQVMLMYRSDYYKSLGQETKPSKNQFTANLQNQVQQSQNRGNDNGSVSVVSINLAKNRNGRVGDITLLFSKNYSRFDNPSLEMEQAAAKMSGVPFDPTDDNG
jgi:replicative DNA helicase